MNKIRTKLYIIVFGTDTPAGRAFDVFLLWTILTSVFVVMLESVPAIGSRYFKEFFIIEWVLTIVFTIEYFVRIWISQKPLKYILSFWGIIDFLSIIPTYLSLFFAGYHYLLIVRIFRLLRVFRVLKLARFSTETQLLIEALKASFHKISIFFLAVISLVTFMGTLMYVVEGGKEGFTSIPQSIYWAVVTITTVGYGDMVPHSVLGKFISSLAMIMGYAIIAVPTGIVTVAMAKVSTQIKECLQCHKMVEMNSSYCKHCGTKFK